MFYIVLSSSTDPVVSSLVFVVDPVEFFVRAVLDAVLGDPLVSIAAALSEDPRHHHHLLQVNLQPLAVVLELGEPGTPGGAEFGTEFVDNTFKSGGKKIHL